MLFLIVSRYLPTNTNACFFQCNFSNDFDSQGVALRMGNGEHCIPFLAPQWTLDQAQ